MKTLTIVLLVILVSMVAVPVAAQSQSYYHEVTMELDGEWDLNSNFVVERTETSPAVTSGMTLKGVGKAKIHSITKAQSVPVWWDLF